MAGPWEKYRSGGQQAVPANPVKVQGAMAGINKTEADTIRTQGQERRDNALFDAERRAAEAEARMKELEAAQKGQEAKQGGLDKQKLANLRAAQSQIDRLRLLYKQGPGKTSGFSGVLDYLPSNANKRFNTAGAGLGEVGLAAFRVPGVGSQSDAELRAFIDANRPSAGDFDAEIQEKLNNLQNRLNQTYSAYGIQRKGGGDDGWKIERLD